MPGRVAVLPSVLHSGRYFIVFLNLISIEAGVIKKEDLIQNNVPEQDTYLSEEDFREAGRLLEVDLHQAGVNTSVDPLLKANKFEGDIYGLSSDQIHQYINDSNSYARNAIRDTWRRWPNGEIPYSMSSRYGTYSKRIIAKAMDEYHQKTCIRFIPRDENVHKDYIYIFPDDGCYSLVGRTGGRQPLSLDSGCIQTGTVQHELMHTTGFFHEQSRSDRDDYIEIVWDNVLQDATDQFEQYTLRTITTLDMPYDYSSIMHYGPFAFTKNGKRTIRAKKSGSEKMGQRDGFSEIDLKKLNKLYDCDKQKDETSVTTAASTTAATTAAATGDCENKKWQCFFWKRLNYCESNTDYMKEQCPKSCDLCSDPKPSADVQTKAYDQGKACVDLDSHCAEWRRKGYCNNGDDAIVIKRKCPKSCLICNAQ